MGQIDIEIIGVKICRLFVDLKKKVVFFKKFGL